MHHTPPLLLRGLIAVSVVLLMAGCAATGPKVTLNRGEAVGVVVALGDSLVLHEKPSAQPTAADRQVDIREWGIRKRIEDQTVSALASAGYKPVLLNVPASPHSRIQFNLFSEGITFNPEYKAAITAAAQSRSLGRVLVVSEADKGIGSFGQSHNSHVVGSGVFYERPLAAPYVLGEVFLIDIASGVSQRVHPFHGFVPLPTNQSDEEKRQIEKKYEPLIRYASSDLERIELESKRSWDLRRPHHLPDEFDHLTGTQAAEVRAAFEELAVQNAFKSVWYLLSQQQK